MSIERRKFLKYSAGSAASISFFSGIIAFTKKTEYNDPDWSQLHNMTGNVKPITVAERQQRIAKAQQLMASNQIQALILDAGTSLNYFTGIRWWPSERTMVAIIPVKGEVTYVSPAFEADRLKELITIGQGVHIWQEDESPYEKIVAVLQQKGITGGSIGMEERLRFFILDGLRKAAPNMNFISGDPISIPCRLIKSPAEIALLQKANDITLAAIQFAAANVKEGMSNNDISAIIGQAQRKMGASSDGALVTIGPASALPHGSIQPQHLKKGDILLMDCGCLVEGYTSDITRTIVFAAPPTQRQRTIWDLEKKAQAAGFAAAQIGQPCEKVDHAARKVLIDAGFGPGYQLPGCPHRTGHGIGMDGHEWGNMVNGNQQPIQVGMCFSVEPTIVVPGEMGLRLEDCAYIAEDGPHWFSKPAHSIDTPFA
ncbi:M24 family metallopeptidase [Hydrotalea lipotrueae]|uniref:M24 family metallopeptidase n=1 Tax=Hydrotalea lipotrueae TaxID=2803817 RepID=UPI001C457C54|nr:Xaa-Pro peptidase family protein [Hydrotalea lipotrueae]